MRHPRTIFASIGLAAVAAVGVVSGAAASGSPANGTPHGHAMSPATAGAAAATVRSTPAAVGGKTETILVDAHGLPLYYYRPDTATRSLVTGGLARLWPPLTSTVPTAAGLSGRLGLLNDAHGHQVTYNGHLLYTFVSDHADQVTGQGLQNFFVATPSLAPVAATPGAPAAPPGGAGY